MDIPDLVEGALDGEEIQAGVSLGDEDAVCLTPTRTLVYRGDGLLSDEAVEEYSHDIEQLAVSEGRRKTKFTMQYIDGTESFTVPANRGEKVLELFLEGVLKLDGVIEDHESLAGVYRFSELTLIIAEKRLIKHIGSQVWSEDYEVYAYDDVTGLEFERASVATSIALSVDGRPQRIKVPNDKAPVVRQTLEGALFNYYDVTNVEELNRVVGGGDPDAGGVDPGGEESGDGFSFGDDFDPLVSEDADLAESVDADERLAEGDSRSGGQPSGDPGRQPGEEAADPASDQSADATAGGAAEPATRGSDAATGGASESAHPNAGQASNGAAGDGADANREGQSGGDSPERPESGPESTGAEHESRSASTESTDSDADAVEDRRAGSGSGEAGTADAPGADAQRPDSRRTTPQRANSPEADAAERADTSPSGGGSAQPEDARADPAAAGDAGPDPADTSTSGSSESPESAGDADGAEPAPVTREEFEAMAERLDELTEAVDRQNELLKRQHRALKQLVGQHSE